MKESSDYIHMGEISGVFGVKGWVKVFSHTAPREKIVKYKTWLLSRSQGDDKYQSIKVLNGRRQGKVVVAQLEGVTDPDQAYKLIGTDIVIERSQLGRLNKGEYYWSELEGLAVVTTTGVDLGKVSWLFETGNNNVLVVKGDRERYIPYITGEVVISVDLQTSQMVVDWDPEF
ncbi:MAG TPA: ribosome maturation factor RimM [Leucothrix mucor]|nr:ribosome maturation factor RimM [Leucothrix mucor]